MDLWITIGSIFLAGSIGGLFNGWRADHWGIRYKKDDCKTWFPGVMGYVLTGGLAAVVFWGVYGPVSGTPIIGVETVADTAYTLTIGELAGSVLLGLGGYSWLSARSGKKCAERLLNGK